MAWCGVIIIIIRPQEDDDDDDVAFTILFFLLETEMSKVQGLKLKEKINKTWKATRQLSKGEEEERVNSAAERSILLLLGGVVETVDVRSHSK